MFGRRTASCRYTSLRVDVLSFHAWVRSNTAYSTKHGAARPRLFPGTGGGPAGSPPSFSGNALR